MGTVPQYRRETDQPRTRMLGLLLILPGLLTAAPASLTKHVVKAPSPIYTAPVYNEHTGQGINHGYGQGLGFGHGQGYANGAHVTPIKPGHVFLDIQLILRVITLATMLVIRLGTMLAIRLATMLAIRLATMLAIKLGTMLGSTLEATSTTQLEASTSSSLPARPPSTSTLASPASDSRLQTPRTEKTTIKSDNIIVWE